MVEKKIIYMAYDYVLNSSINRCKFWTKGELTVNLGGRLGKVPQLIWPFLDFFRCSVVQGGLLIALVISLRNRALFIFYLVLFEGSFFYSNKHTCLWLHN